MLVVVATGILLSGCATQAPKEPPEPEFVPNASYSLLMAEIALQRKAYLTAAEEYLKAASQSDDPELAMRATEFALEYGFDALADSVLIASHILS